MRGRRRWSRCWRVRGSGCRWSAGRRARCGSGGARVSGGRYEVGQLVEHRVEPGPGRQVWRVEAVRSGRSRTSFAGVFDLTWEPAGDRWSLVRVHD